MDRLHYGVWKKRILKQEIIWGNSLIHVPNNILFRRSINNFIRLFFLGNGSEPGRCMVSLDRKTSRYDFKGADHRSTYDSKYDIETKSDKRNVLGND